jgi:hypothetical protein
VYNVRWGGGVEVAANGCMSFFGRRMMCFDLRQSMHAR